MARLRKLLPLLLYLLAPTQDASAEEKAVWIPPGHVEPLTFGMLLAVDAAAGPRIATTRAPGLSIGDARLRLIGEVEYGFSYLLQTNFIDRPALLDAQINWTAETTGSRISAGYFRTPTSGELLIAAPDLDLIDRATVVRALAPGRQVGVQLNQPIVDRRMVARAGVFNGNGLNQNDDNRFLYTLRIDGVFDDESSAETYASPPLEGLSYGVSAAYSEDDQARLGLDLPAPFSGTRWLAGGDLRWQSGPLLLSAEGLYSSIDLRNASRRDLFGYQATIGWTFNALVQILARYDAFWGGSLVSDRDFAIASLSLSFGRYVFLQTELRVPTRGEGPTPGGAASLSIQF
jgi:hypothetical protein